MATEIAMELDKIYHHWALFEITRQTFGVLYCVCVAMRSVMGSKTPPNHTKDKQNAHRFVIAQQICF